MVDERTAVGQQALEIATNARSLAITISTRDDYQRAGELREAIKSFVDKVISHHQPIIDASQRALDAARSARDSYLIPLKEADRLLMDGRSKWAAEEQRRQDEERRRVEAERRRQAEEKATEVRRQLEEQRRQAEEAARKADEERRLREAEEAAKRGDAAAADAILDAPATPLVVEGPSQEEIDAIVEAEKVMQMTPAPVVNTAPAVRWLYSAEVTDLKALVGAIAAGTVPITAVEANGPVLNKLANAMREGFQVPGCRLLKRPVDNRRTK